MSKIGDAIDQEVAATCMRPRGYDESDYALHTRLRIYKDEIDDYKRGHLAGWTAAIAFVEAERARAEKRADEIEGRGAEFADIREGVLDSLIVPMKDESLK